MDYKIIEQLVKTVSESEITSFEIDTEGFIIRMEKTQQQVVVEKEPVKVIEKESTARKVILKENIATNEVNVENLFIVKSPIVGTMYFSPSVDSKKFVEVGSKVKVGDTLCILEAMKLMNEIQSEVDGEILEVLVSNEDMVEYGQPLFRIIKN